MPLFGSAAWSCSLKRLFFGKKIVFSKVPWLFAISLLKYSQKEMYMRLNKRFGLLKKFGVAAFLFFLIKGLAWLAVIFGIWKVAS